MFQRQAQLSDSLEAEENAQHPTPNAQLSELDVGRSALSVRRCRPTSTTVKTRPKKPPKGTRRGKTRRWSAQVTKRSDALDLRFRRLIYHRVRENAIHLMAPSQTKSARAWMSKIDARCKRRCKLMPFTQSHPSTKRSRVSSTPVRQICFISSSSR